MNYLNTLEEKISVKLKELKKGLFIVFDGMDGCGKSTQCNLLQNKLKELQIGKEIHLTSEPYQNELGKMIRELLKNDSTNSYIDALLFTANRMQHLNYISPLLEKKDIVICDRYLDSTLNYQETQYYFPNQPRINNEIRDWLLNLNKYITFPDLVFILDMNVKDCMKNIVKANKQKEKFEKIEFLTNLNRSFLTHKGFHELNNIISPKEFSNTDYYIIDCSLLTIEEIHNEVLFLLEGSLRLIEGIDF